MSSEQVSAARPVDQRTDVCSLGLTLYECLTGRKAFPAMNRANLLSQVMDRVPERPSLVEHSVPLDLDTIVMTAIEKDPDARYQSAVEMADDLQRFLDNRPIVARPIGQLERSRRWIGRNPAVATLIAIVSLLMLALAVGSTAVALRLKDVANDRLKNLYAQEMFLAATDVHRGDVVGAERRLKKWIPEGGEEDQRGFEWYELWRRCHNEALLHTIDHRLFAFDVHFLPGDRLAVGWWTTSLPIWNTDDLRPDSVPEILLERLPMGISTIAHHEPSCLVAAGNGSGQVGVWNYVSGVTQGIYDLELPLNGDNIRSLAFSPNGRLLAIGAHKDGTGAARVLDLHEREWEFEVEYASDVAFLNDQTLLVVSAVDGEFAFYSTQDWQPIRQWETDVTDVIQMDYCRQTNRIVLAASGDRGLYQEGVVAIFDATSGEQLSTIHFGRERVTSVDFSDSGELLAIGTHFGKMLLIDGGTYQVVHETQAHAKSVNGLAFSSDGAQLASASGDTEVHIWNVQRLLGMNHGFVEWDYPGMLTHGATFVDNNTVCVSMHTGQNGLLQVRNVSSGEVDWETRVASPGLNVWHHVLSPDRRFVALTAGKWPFEKNEEKRPTGMLFVYDLLSGEKTSEVEIPNGIFYTRLAFHNDNRHVALCSYGTVVVVDAPRSVITKTLPVDGWIKNVTFSPDGSRLFCPSTSGMTRVYSFPECELVAEFRADKTMCQFSRFTPDGRHVAMVGLDNQVNLFDEAQPPH